MNIEVNYEKLSKVLELSKTLKCDVVVIPRIITQQDPLSSIIGIYGTTIVTQSTFTNIINEPLWDVEGLTHISLYTKDIAPFNRELGNYGKDRVILEYNVYGNLNGRDIVYGYNIRSMCNTEGQYISIPLLDPTNSIDLIVKIISSYHSLLLLNENSPIKSDEVTNDSKFQEIINSKTAVGAQLWIPEFIKNTSFEEGHVITLANNFLNVSKGDVVHLTIKDDYYNRIPHSFLVEFAIYKPKKKCLLLTYMWLLKIY